MRQVNIIYGSFIQFITCPVLHITSQLRRMETAFTVHTHMHHHYYHT